MCLHGFIFCPTGRGRVLFFHVPFHNVERERELRSQVCSSTCHFICASSAGKLQDPRRPHPERHLPADDEAAPHHVTGRVRADGERASEALALDKRRLFGPGTGFRITFWITSDKAVRERSGTMSLPLESLPFSLLRKRLLSQSHQTSSFTSLITVKNLVLVVGAKKCLSPAVLSNSSGLPNVLSLSLVVGLTGCGIFVVFQTSGRCTLLKGL